MSEDSLYKSGGISITKSLVKIWDTSYAVKNIDSVGIGKQNTNSYWTGTIIAFLVFVFFAFNAYQEKKSVSSVSIFDVAPAGLAVIFTILFFYMAIKPKYYLKFRMSSSESRTFESREYSDLGPIKFAIERAIVANNYPS